MLESFSSDKFEYKRIPLEEQEKRQILGRLAGVIADTKSPTRNGRKYSKDLWEKVFNDPIMKEKIANRCVFAELGHPSDREEVDMEKVCACLSEQPKISDDGKIYGVFDILNTANGRILKTLCDYGTNIGVSSRGTGDLYTDENGEEAVDPETYNCECWDIVVVPAVESARLKYVTEALDAKRYNKTLKQKLNEQLESATIEERKIMKESLDTLLNIDEAAYTRDELMDKFGTDDLDLINAGNEEDVTLDMGSDLVPNDAEVATDPKPTETEGLDEKLIAVPEDKQAEVEERLKAMGWEIEGKGRTFMDSIHYQLVMKFDHDVTREDARPVVAALEKLDSELEAEEIPMTFNLGLHVNGNNMLSCGLDLHKQYIEEELENEDGWGRRIIGALEPVFDRIEKLIYEVRRGRRDTYAGIGDEAMDLADELSKISSALQDGADEIMDNSDELDETVHEELESEMEDPKDAKYFQYQYNLILDDLVDLLKEMDGNGIDRGSYTYKTVSQALEILDDNQQLISEADERGVKKFDNPEEAKKFIASLPDGVEPRMDCFDTEEDGEVKTWYEVYYDESVSESCDDTELDECGSVDPVMDNQMEELTEALLKVKELEKDNLSLQEKLSVCNAKEVQLGEELKKYKASTASLSESAKQTKALTESVKTYTKELNEKDELIESLKKKASLVEELNTKVQKLEEELDTKYSDLNEMNTKLNRYRSSLKSTRELYLEALVNAYGLDINEVRRNLTESYQNKDIKRVCDALLEEKRNLSKLPFALTENVRIQAKSNMKDVQKGKTYNYFDDDNTDSLLNLINL